MRSKHVGGWRSAFSITALIATSFMLTSCATMMQSPLTPETRGFLDGTQFVLTKPYAYRIGRTDQTILVPQGFVTDYATIPPPFRMLFERQGRHSRATVIHDYLYWSQTCTRTQADNLFLIAMKELGVKVRDQLAIHRAVKIGGGAAWRANSAERAKQMPRFVPTRYYGLTDNHTWASARTRLRNAGEKDPPLPTSAAYCVLGNTTSVP